MRYTVTSTIQAYGVAFTVQWLKAGLFTQEEAQQLTSELALQAECLDALLDITSEITEPEQSPYPQEDITGLWGPILAYLQPPEQVLGFEVSYCTQQPLTVQEAATRALIAEEGAHYIQSVLEPEGDSHWLSWRDKQGLALKLHDRLGERWGREQVLEEARALLQDGTQQRTMRLWRTSAQNS